MRLKRTLTEIFLFLVKPLIFIVLMISVFGIVYLRSNVTRLEYDIGELEKKKLEYVKERKLLLAKKTNLLSFEKIGMSLNLGGEYILQDRLKVIYVDKQRGILPYKASFKNENLTEP